MTIETLLARAQIQAQVQGDEQEIRGLCYDSRKAEPGDLFICLRGEKTDGHSFAAEAYAKGVRAFLVEEKLSLPQDQTQIFVENTRQAMPDLAAAFWGHPARKMKLVGITGTNGKTTTTFLLRSILQAAGKKVGLVGTIGNFLDQEFKPAQRTTPEAPDLQAMLARMLQRKIGYLVMEVSSHAIHQKRVCGEDFQVGVFTNLSQDHLDYHKTMEEYCQVKAGFLRQIPKEGTVVINLDDPAASKMQQGVKGEVLGYSLKEGQVQGEILSLSAGGMQLLVTTPLWQEEICLPLSGRFNAENALAAVAAAISLGIDQKAIVEGLQEAERVPGRFQQVGEGRPTVIVDYAHTPDGLANVLATARSLPIERLIVVFGCGGDRDRGKRPQMGKLAGEMADLSIITSDNPRTEDPPAICRDVEAGLLPTGGEYILEPDRRRAIERAISLAGEDDLVLIAGKGHETYQIFRDRTIHFDDAEEAARCLKEREH